MKIVFLDGYTINPGDLTWAPLEALGDFVVYDRTDPAEVVPRAADADVVIVNKTVLGEAELTSLPRLKLICVAATGFDRIDTATARKRGITVCNCAGYSSESVAQMAVSLLLEAIDSVGHYTAENRRGVWTDCPDFCYTSWPRMELAGKRAAIVGFGNIGQTLARILSAFGMEIWAVTAKDASALPPHIRKATLAEAFSQCHVVSLNCPLTPANRGFVNEALLRTVRPGLLLVNTARGALVHEEAVAEALRAGRLGAYCTDVLATEPPQADCPLLAAPRCFVTPHIGWDTPEARLRILHILENNIRAFVAGSPVSVVN